jgi:hypothetical protein
VAPPPFALRLQRVPEEELLTGLTDDDRFRRIRCPLCAWRPVASSRWFCTQCNDCSWNTFDTRGKCPKCAYQWRYTACLSCHKFSPHEDWYELRDKPPP